mgnify:CR=1 FL=1
MKLFIDTANVEEIRKAIEDPIANILVACYDTVIDEIRVSVHDEKIVVTYN